MKKTFSPKWISSKQTRKQRKYRYNAPMHVRQRLVGAHLSKSLRKQHGKRSLPVRKGDEVMVMRGDFAKTRGKVTDVDMKKLKIYIDNVKRKKATGQDVHVAIDPSNVVITEISADKRRLKSNKPMAKKVEKKTEKEEKKTGKEIVK